MGPVNWLRLAAASSFATALAVAGYVAPAGVPAAASSGLRAIVVSVTAKPATVTAAGGTVVVTATVSHATSCHLELLSAEPFPVTYSHNPKNCAGGRYSAKVTIGANPGKLKRTVTLVLVAYNNSSSFAGRVRVALAPRPPHTATGTGPPATVGTTTTTPTIPVMPGSSPVPMPASLFRQSVQGWAWTPTPSFTPLTS